MTNEHARLGDLVEGFYGNAKVVGILCANGHIEHPSDGWHIECGRIIPTATANSRNERGLYIRTWKLVKRCPVEVTAMDVVGSFAESYLTSAALEGARIVWQQHNG